MVHGKGVGILGDGGSAADCVIGALEGGGAAYVVVWGTFDRSPLVGTRAYEDLLAKHEHNICRVGEVVDHVAYAPNATVKITINRSVSPNCAFPSGKFARPV
jgi:hypothetical protein